MKNEITIVRLTEDQFSNISIDWQELLTNTSSDQLFLSWFWMYQWWTQCSNSDSDELLLLVAYDENKLVGIAPLYISKQKIKYSLTSKRVLFLGTNPNGHSALRSEYLELIVHPDYGFIIDEIYDYIIENIRFSEIYFQNLINNSDTYNRLNKFSGYVRLSGRGATYSIPTTKPFSDYVSELGSKTRLKCFGRRKNLKAEGELEILIVNSEHLELLFEILFELQKDRWDVDETSLKLRREFVENLLDVSDIGISGVIIKYDQSPIACALDLKVQGRVYGFQLAYKHDFNNKFTLGLLTVIYDAEQYFNDPEIKYYDLLEGRGKSNNYKAHIALEDKDLITISIIKMPLLSILYRTYDSIKMIRDAVQKKLTSKNAKFNQ